MNIDKTKIRETIQKSRNQDIAYFLVNEVDKNSKKTTIAEIEKLISKGTCEVIVIKS